MRLCSLREDSGQDFPPLSFAIDLPVPRRGPLRALGDERRSCAFLFGHGFSLVAVSRILVVLFHGALVRRARAFGFAGEESRGHGGDALAGGPILAEVA